MIGPVKIRNVQGPNQKYEAECHLCSWAFFTWTIDEVREILLWHLENTHFNPRVPYILKPEDYPGR